MSKVKKKVVLTEDDWLEIIYILGALSGATGYADEIERQLFKKK